MTRSRLTSGKAYPVIIYTKSRLACNRLEHILVLTDTRFYEDLDDCDWASGADFSYGVERLDEGSLPDKPGLAVACFRIEEGDDEAALIQESQWRSLTPAEALRLAQGDSIDFVLGAGATG